MTPVKGVATHRLRSMALACSIGIHVCASCCCLAHTTQPWSLGTTSTHFPASQPCLLLGFTMLWWRWQLSQLPIWSLGSSSEVMCCWSEFLFLRLDSWWDLLEASWRERFTLSKFLTSEKEYSLLSRASGPTQGDYRSGNLESRFESKICMPMVGIMVQTYNSRYSEVWGNRITWAQEFKNSQNRTAHF